MNSGGVRGGLLYNQISGGEQPGEVTYGEAFTVQPFGNTLVVKTCTGQQIYDVLNQQFNNPAAGLEPDHAALGERPLPVDRDRRRRTSWTGRVSFDGGATVIDKAATYRVTMNNFMADGGDNYTVFRSCTSRSAAKSTSTRSRATSAHSPLAPPALNRIEKVG